MGGGRKTKTVIVNEKEKFQTNWTWNCSVTARNLRKSDLAGIIFGCKHSTIRECLKENLFGLPAPHFSYVKNIDPGLPLFLFNYSDRKLYGVFEAASHGRLNINPNGWTTDGSDTPYAAQVRIRIRMECQPLLEDQFGPIISNNYYEPRLFWFELDRDQTKKLISMFSSVRITSSTSLSKNMDKKSTTHWLNTSSYPNKANTKCGSSWDAPGETVFVDDNAEKNEDGVGVGLVEPNNWPSFAAVVRGVQTSPQKTWSSLFKDSTTSDDRKGLEDITTLTQELNLSSSDHSKTEWDSYCSAPCSDEKRMCLEAVGDDYKQQGLRINNEVQHSYSSIMTEGPISFAESTPYGVVTADDLKQDGKDFRMATSKMNPYLTAEWNSSCFVPDLVTESHPFDALVDEDGEEHVHFQSSGEGTSSSAITKENISKHNDCQDRWWMG